MIVLEKKALGVIMFMEILVHMGYTFSLAISKFSIFYQFDSYLDINCFLIDGQHISRSYYPSNCWYIAFYAYQFNELAGRLIQFLCSYGMKL